MYVQAYKTITKGTLFMAYNKPMNMLKLNHKVPIIAFQGLTVKVNIDGSFDMLFQQETDIFYDEKGNQTTNADVVAAIHIPDVKRWKQIKELVEQQINVAENRES